MIQLHPAVADGTTAACQEITRLLASCPTDVLRLAVLVEVAGTAAALARTLARVRHVDPAALLPYTTRPVDVYAVLGRGRWLPTMHPVPDDRDPEGEDQ